MDNTSSSITKGTHGGARKGAGRPRKTVVSVAQNQRDTTLGYPIRSNIGHKTSHPSAPPAAFFLPRNTNQPVPSGSQQIHAQAGRAFWADIVASQSDADTLPAASCASTLDKFIFAHVHLAVSHISSREFTQLNEQLDYVQEHDEHGDISVGDNFIDDSIVDHSVDKSNPETLDPEPETVEPPGNSALHKQLLALQARLMQEEAVHGKPLCYTRGDFFDRPEHPIFALQTHKDKVGLEREPLYWRKVFVWLPHLLPGPETFKCTCGMPLTRNGVLQ